MSLMWDDSADEENSNTLELDSRREIAGTNLLNILQMKTLSLGK